METIDTRLKFINLAIQNGYDESNCNGWKWIRENLNMLDYIFKSQIYIDIGFPYISKCMKVICEGMEFTYTQRRVLETAWYLNNERNSIEAKQKKLSQIIQAGFIRLNDKINPELISKDKKVFFIIWNFDREVFSQEKKGRIIQDRNQSDLLYVMPLRCTRRGYSSLVHEIYIKEIPINRILKKG